MTRPLRLGIAGWGIAGQFMAAAAGRSERVELAAIADPDTIRRSLGVHQTGVPGLTTLGDLARRDDVDAVYIATPTALHAGGVSEAARAGKHVIVEKPLAESLEMALTACREADAAGVVLLVGCTHSYDAPIRLLRDLVVSGRLGALQGVLSVCYTDWLARPRSGPDLQAAAGGGLVLRQGAHQMDVVRLITGGLIETVHGETFGGDLGTELGYSAVLRTAEGVVATLFYSGLGGFDSRLLTGGVGELAETLPPICGVSVLDLDVGGEAGRSRSPSFGLTVATFDAGEAVVTPYGLSICQGRSYTGAALPVNASSGWDAALAELADVVTGQKPPVHTGYWGAATLEACWAIHDSSTAHRPVTLTHQIGTGDSCLSNGSDC